MGGKKKGKGRHYVGNKTPVVAMVERKGTVRSMVMARVNSKNIKAMLKEHVQTSANLMTNESKPYPAATRDFASHQKVNHSQQEYVRGEVHTNTVERYFSLIKRGIIGTFHHVSKKHLPLYLAEFDHRYNHREVTDGERTLEGLAKAEGKRLTYKSLQPSAAHFFSNIGHEL